MKTFLALMGALCLCAACPGLSYAGASDSTRDIMRRIQLVE
jgi:hypothetical protein